MRAIRVLGRNINNAFKSVFRNLSLSLASIICTTITLIIVSVAVLITVNLNSFTKDLENEITIVVFLDRGINEEQIESVKNKILALDNVAKDTIETKTAEEVKNELMNEHDSFKNIMSTWTKENNPLQPEIIVSVEDVKDIGKTEEEINKLELVNHTQCGEQMVKELLSVFNIVHNITIGIIISLIVVTVFLICNTIKLTIFSRRSEIDIMRLVGTSNTVIKLPFVIEGLFLGIAGSIIPIVLTVYGYIIAYDKLGGYFTSSIIKMVKPMPLIIYDSLLLLIIGSVVGMIGSYSSVRKYLKI
ncbi:MAG: permease-like cell division protein FtsX [Bacilli bacterium]